MHIQYTNANQLVFVVRSHKRILLLSSILNISKVSIRQSIIITNINILEDRSRPVDSEQPDFQVGAYTHSDDCIY